MGRRVVGIHADRGIELRQRRAVGLRSGGDIIERHAAQEGLIGGDRRGTADLLLLGGSLLGLALGGDLGNQRDRHGFGNLRLHREHILKRPVVGFGPAQLAVIGRDQFGRDPHTRIVALHAAAQDVADVELATDSEIILARDRRGRGRRGDPEPRIAGQNGAQFACEAIGEVLLVRLTRLVGDRHHHHRDRCRGRTAQQTELPRAKPARSHRHSGAARQHPPPRQRQSRACRCHARRGRKGRSRGGLIAAQLGAHRHQNPRRFGAGGLAVPPADIEQLELAEAQWRHCPVDGQRHQTPALAPALCLVAHPVGCDRSCRPQHHHAGRRFQRGLGGLEEVLAPFQPAIPPHVEARSVKQVDHRPGAVQIAARIADEQQRTRIRGRVVAAIHPNHPFRA